MRKALAFYLGMAAVGLAAWAAGNPVLQMGDQALLGALAGLGSFVVPKVLDFFGKRSSNKAQEKASQDQVRLQNEYLAKDEAARAKILSMLQESGWNPAGVNKLNSGETSSSSSVQNVNQTNKPIITSEYQPIEGKLRELISGRLGRGQYSNEEFVKRNLVNRVRAINAANAGSRQSVLNTAATRGLSGAQRAALAQSGDAVRAGQIADVVGNVPMEARELENQDMARAQGLTEAFGKGNQLRGTTTTNTNQTSSGFREVGPDISSLMALTRPAGPQGSMLTGRSGTGELLSGAADLTGALAQYGQNAGWFGSAPKPKFDASKMPANIFWRP